MTRWSRGTAYARWVIDQTPEGAVEEHTVSLEPKPERHDLACIDVAKMRGLEIGPLTAPRIHKNEGDVLYVDHTDAAGLRRKYAANPVMQGSLDQILEIDYIVGNTLGIHEVVADRAPFDYVMASHLIEHIPDPVAWLFDIAKVLRPRGILSLIIPDKRFTFDINRRTTEISDLVDAYLRGLRKPSFRDVYKRQHQARGGARVCRQTTTSSTTSGTLRPPAN